MIKVNQGVKQLGILVNIWVALTLLNIAGCGNFEANGPGNWMKQGALYEVDTHLQTHFTQHFEGRSYLDTTKGFARWQIQFIKEIKDTLWCNLWLRQIQSGKEINNLNQLVPPITFMLIGGKPLKNSDSLSYFVETQKEAAFQYTGKASDANGLRTRQMVNAWLQPSVVEHLLIVLYGIWPGGIPISGRIWDGYLPVWHPIPGSFHFRGSFSSVTNEAIVITLDGRYSNLDIVNPSTLLPLGGQLSGKMQTLITYPSDGNSCLLYSHTDSLYGHLLVGGRKVPSTILSTMSIEVKEIE